MLSVAPLVHIDTDWARSQHDQKRRESEVQSLHQRLQKLTTAPASSTSSESAFTRFTILNGASPASSPIAATFAVTQTGRSASRTASRVPAHAAIPSAAASALEAAELELVRTTLDERISACSHLERENRDLRTFVGEVGEWAEGVLEIEELASMRKDREEGGEMREVLNDGDEVRNSACSFQEEKRRVGGGGERTHEGFADQCPVCAHSLI